MFKLCLAIQSKCAILVYRPSPLGVENGPEVILFRKGPLLEAMEQGHWIVIEDTHLANNDVIESLNSLCEENQTLKITAGNQELIYVSRKSKQNEIRIHSNFRIFFTISDSTLHHFTGPFLSRYRSFPKSVCDHLL